MKLIELQQQFLDYLHAQKIGETHAMSAEVVDQGNITADQRLEIYASAYRIRLVQVIETDHPGLCTYLGDDLFDQMARGFLNKHPSQERSLRDFCRPLPGYLESNPPFSEHPILAEMAAFEIRLRDSFDAPDKERLEFEQMQQLPAEQWPTVQLRLHPSVQIFKAAWNSVESWQAIKAENTPQPASAIEVPMDVDGQDTFQAWLLWRGRDLLTQFRSLDIVEYQMLQCVLKGMSFADLCEHLLLFIEAEQVGETAIMALRGWFDAGMITKI